MNTVQPIRSKSQVMDIAAYLRGKSERDYILFLFGIYSGLRISDILPLKVRDVKGKSRLYMREQKTGKERSISINKELQKPLADYVSDLEEWEYLFPSRQRTSRIKKEQETKPLTRQRAIQILKAACARFGIENIGTHTLRKTFGYHMYQDTKDIATIQAIFNHSSPTVTFRYIGIDQDKKDSLVMGFSFKR